MNNFVISVADPGCLSLTRIFPSCFPDPVARRHRILDPDPQQGVLCRVPDPDPDPPDPHVFGPPGSGSTSQRYGSGSGSGSFYHHAKIVRKTLIPSIL
jgi:hypothetical protein